MFLSYLWLLVLRDHTRNGVRGICNDATPSGASASKAALTRAANAPVVGPSPCAFCAERIVHLEDFR